MENKITIEEFLNKVKDGQLLYSRIYIPLQEKTDIIDLALTILFGRFDDDNNLIETDVYQEPNVLIDDMFKVVSIFSAYSDIDVKDRVSTYDMIMEKGYYRNLLDITEDAKIFDQLFEIRIAEKREFLKDSYMNQQNETLTTLVSNLVAKELEVQKLQQKVLEQQDKINSQFTKEDIEKYVATFNEVNNNFNSKEYISSVTDSVHKLNNKKKPQDHKKAQSKPKLEVVDNTTTGE
jgi:hypothetical protein